MKTLRSVSMSIIALLAGTCIYAQTKSDPSPWELLQEFHKNTEKWKLAYNSGDAQNLLSLYTEDADYISSHVTGLEANGRSNILAYFQNGINMGGHIDSIEIIKINVDCGIATLLCKYQATNAGVTVSGRNLLVMRKIDGIWVISLHMTVV
ncbi:MAG: YybH family protein [Bacteroidota bacterium]